MTFRLGPKRVSRVKHLVARAAIGGGAVARLSAGVAVLLFLCGLVVAGCGSALPSSPASDVRSPQSESVASAPTSAGTKEGLSAEQQSVTEYSRPLAVTYDELDLDSSWSAKRATGFITLAGSAVRFDGNGASVNGRKVTIQASGTYVVTGWTKDAQIVVDLKERGLVRLVLNGVDLGCSDDAPIHVKQADRTVLVLPAGTQNRVADGDLRKTAAAASSANAAELADAAIYSKDNLTIVGSGSLTVEGNYRDGIVSKDELKIVGGAIAVTAKNDAVKGRDSLGIKNGNLVLVAGGDGLQASNDQEKAKGFVEILGGTISMSVSGDGIQAESTLAIKDGTLKIATGNSSAAVTSAKGVKAAGALFVEGGTIEANCSDDCLHSNGDVIITGGALRLASDDDAIHADNTVAISGGDVIVSKSLEGLEGKIVNLTGGTLRISANDDGINVVGATSNVAVLDATGGVAPGPAGRRGFFGVPNDASPENQLHITGGLVVVNAYGDGLDCNGVITMTGGTVIVDGPSENMNGAIDYGSGEFSISGGFLVAVGSAGMAQAPGVSSSQCSLLVNFDQPQSAGTLVHVEDEQGNGLVTISPTKQFQSLVISSPALKLGASYSVYLGGSCSGPVSDGLWTGTYAPGTRFVQVTLTGITTVYGQAAQMGPAGPKGRMNWPVPGRQ